MSLINGMDDIITHMKNQELRIKQLEEENKSLTEQRDKKIAEVAEIMKETMAEYVAEQLNEKDKIIKQLTEENEELKEFKKEADDTCGASVVMDRMMDQLSDRDEQVSSQGNLIEHYERIRQKEKYSSDLIDCLIMKIIQMSPDNRIMDNCEHVCVTYPFLCNNDLMSQEKERDNFDEFVSELVHDLNMRDWNGDGDDEMKIEYDKIHKEPLSNDYGFKFSIRFSDTSSEDP